MEIWDVIQEGLLHLRPKRDQKWLAEELGVGAQAVTNWKTRGVPPRQYRQIAKLLNITVDQLEGVEPLPWAKERPWPFSAALYEAVSHLRPPEQDQVEAMMWTLLEGELRTDDPVDRQALRDARPVTNGTKSRNQKRAA